MANKHNGEVSLLVGEKAFTLKLTHNKAAEAEPFMGKPIFEIDHSGIAEIRALLFVMTRGQHGVNGIDDAGDLLEDDPIACMSAVNKALDAFFQKYAESQQAAAAAA